MKYLRQFYIILLFSFLGERASLSVLPLPVPASVLRPGSDAGRASDRNPENTSGKGNGGIFN